MKRFAHLLRQPELHAFLFCLGLVFLNWPVVSMFLHQTPLVVVTIFSFWSLAIVLLYLIGRACNSSDSESSGPEWKNHD